MNPSTVADHSLDPLILDFLEWIAAEPRSYPEVMDAWRTSCPRLTVWEEATERGFVARRSVVGQNVVIELTPRGRDFLRQREYLARVDGRRKMQATVGDHRQE